MHTHKMAADCRDAEAIALISRRSSSVFGANLKVYHVVGSVILITVLMNLEFGWIYN